MPGATRGGLVAIKSELRRERHRGDGIGEAEVAGRVINRIGADDHQRFDRPGAGIGDERLERGDAADY